ncbi:MAG: hypothetical protein JNL58_13725 [Planctomyces sp.]|nr:hypothetical protein [Planctomyces sp.]
MNRNILLLSIVVSSLSAFADTASAGIPIPILYGDGEEIKDVGEVPPEVARSLADELGAQVRVGFLYHRFHIFWLDAWTSNGRHVLYSGDKYWTPTSSEWPNIIGGDPAEKFGIPLLYRIPPILGILSCVLVLWVVAEVSMKSDVQKLNKLLNDKRYRKSIEIMFGASSSGKLVTKLHEDRWQRAMDYLLGEGISHSIAEKNLRVLVGWVLENTNQQIDRMFEAASMHEQQGEWETCAAIYSQLISSLPDDDERVPYAQNCLAAANARQTVHSAPGGR